MDPSTCSDVMGDRQGPKGGNGGSNLKLPTRAGRFLHTVISDPLINSLRAAVEASPGDLPLRLHFAEMLATRGEQAEAVRHAAVVLQQQPDNASALSIVTRGAMGQPLQSPGPDAARSQSDGLTDDEKESLRRLEAGLEGVIPPAFVDEEGVGTGAFDVEPAGLRLSDVGGMVEVKERLEADFLAPLRNPDLVRLYGKSLRGGLLLYGPRVAARRSSPGPSPVRWERGSLPYRWLRSWTCTSVRASGTCTSSSRRLDVAPPASSFSTRSMLWVRSGVISATTPRVAR